MTIAVRAPRRRPRRANSFKDLQRLLPVAVTTYEISRAARLRSLAAKLNDTDHFSRVAYLKAQKANVHLGRYGVQLIANDRAFHIYEEWKGAIGAAWLDDGEAGRVLRHLKSWGLDTGAPVPLWRQRLRLGLSSTDTYGGPSAYEKKLATERQKKINAEIMALRDADPAIVAADEAYERHNRRLEGLIPGIHTTHWEKFNEVLSEELPRRRAARTETRVLASDCRVLDPITLAVLRVIPARQGTIPATKKTFLFQLRQPRSKIDADNVFDSTSAGRPDRTGNLDPLVEAYA